MNNIEFVNFEKEALNKPVMYMWGDYGRVITESTITAKAAQYPDHYTEAYQDELRKQIGIGIGCDCTGLIKWFIWTGGDINVPPKYNAASDNSASGWYNTATVRGDIGTMPEIQGLIVSKSGHCGVYIGGGSVIECTKGSIGNGVFMTKLADGKWEKWCECAYIDYLPVEEVPGDDGYYDMIYKTAIAAKDCPAWSTLNKSSKIGTVYKGDKMKYLGDIEGLCAVIYPAGSTQKIAFIDKVNVVV